MNDALDAPLLLDFYRNDETLAADGDQFVLNCPAFGQASQITPQGFLNLAPLFLHLTANARELWGSLVVEGTVGEDFVAKAAEKIREIGNRRRKTGHRPPFHPHCRGRVQSNSPPF